MEGSPDPLAIFVITNSHQPTNNRIFLRVILHGEQKDARTTLLSFGDKITSIGQTICEILTLEISRTRILKTCFGHFHPFVTLGHIYAFL